MNKVLIVFTVALLFIACKDKQKNEKVKEDIQDRMENVRDKIDTTMDKVRNRLEEIRDTVKSKIHRATAPDSNQ